MLSIITDFGAVGDNVADDTSAFQAAITSGKEVYIDIPTIGYKITKALLINNPTSLIGAKNKSLLLPSGFNDYLFHILSSDVSLEGLKIVAPQNNLVSGFYLPTNQTALNRIRLENIFTYYLYHGIVDDGNLTNRIIDLTIDKVYFRGHCGYGLLLGSSYAFLIINEFSVDAMNENGTLSLFTLSNNSGVWMDKVFLLGNTPQNLGQNGYTFNNCAAIHMNQCHADTLGGRAYQFTGCQYVQANDLTASLCNQHGVFLNNITDSIFTNIVIQGRNGLPGAASSITGMYLYAACDNLIIDGLRSQNNTAFNYWNNPANTNIKIGVNIT